MKKESRICFYNNYDLAWTIELKKANTFIRKFDSLEYEKFNTNDYIELFQIKLFFDNDLSHPEWDENFIRKHKDATMFFWIKIKEYWKQIEFQDLTKIIDNLYYEYKKYFWIITEMTELYKQIDSDNFQIILQNKSLSIRHILKRKKIVKHFDNTIKNILLNLDISAELLLTQYVEKHDSKYESLHFPSSLTLIDKESIIIKYIDSESPNLNYIQLINKSRDSSELRISDKTKLKANKKEKKITSEILNNNGKTIRVGSGFAVNKKQPITFEKEENGYSKIYSVDHFDKLITPTEILKFFISLSKFTDELGNINLVSKENDLIIFEKICVKSKTEYLVGSVFFRKFQSSIIELITFSKYLESRDLTIEKLINAFIDERINNELGLKNLKIHLPDNKSSLIEKIRNINPEIESILRQYKLFTEDGTIDHELNQFSSKSSKISSTPSILKNKYFYNESDKEINEIQYYFFSENSSLLYNEEKTKRNYKSFIEVILNEKFNINILKDYNLEIINRYIEKGFLSLEENIIKIENWFVFNLSHKLYKNETSNFWNYNELSKIKIQQLINNERLKIENKLFSIPEQNFLNFILNKQKYSNGLDLRNKYSHGSNKYNPEINQFDYYTCLLILILSLIKIEDELTTCANN